jgi:hypothetical protein
MRSISEPEGTILYLVPLHTVFPNPNLVGDEKVFPSLEHISLDCTIVDYGDWSPLMTFLACRVSSGNRLDTLVIIDSPHMCPEVMEGIRGMVRELKIIRQNPLCPFGTCPEP